MKSKIVFLVFILFSSSLCAKTFSKQEQIPANHWIYEAMYILLGETQSASVLDTAPLNISEIELSFYSIEYEKLSNSGKRLYQKVQDFLEPAKTFDLGPVRLGLNVIFNPELSYNSNTEIKWNVTDSELYEPGCILITPLSVAFSDYVFIETDPHAAGKLYPYKKSNDSLVWNVPVISPTGGYNGFEAVMYTENAQASIGKKFNKWGIALNVGNQGLQVGKTLNGSIILNSAFRSDYYAQLAVFSEKVKYNMDVLQLNKETFMYVHVFEAAPFNWLKLGLTEGTLLNHEFELRFLNPLYFMHSFGANYQYSEDNPASQADKKNYGEINHCAYFALSADVFPVKNMRIYLLYAQNEIQSPPELDNEEHRAIPDSLGVQLGIEYTIPTNEGFWLTTVEGILTTPYLYLKQTQQSSLYSGSWIGTPFGPDAAALSFSAKYTNISKFSLQTIYTFLAHGENEDSVFEKVNPYTGYYTYYPSSAYLQGLLTASQAEKIARSYQLSGVISYTNSLVFKGEYKVTEHFSMNGQLTYLLVLNNNHEADNIQQGIQLHLSCKTQLQ